MVAGVAFPHFGVVAQFRRERRYETAEDQTVFKAEYGPARDPWESVLATVSVAEFTEALLGRDFTATFAADAKDELEVAEEPTALWPRITVLATTLAAEEKGAFRVLGETRVFAHGASLPSPSILFDLNANSPEDNVHRDPRCESLSSCVGIGRGTGIDGGGFWNTRYPTYVPTSKPPMKAATLSFSRKLAGGVSGGIGKNGFPNSDSWPLAFSAGIMASTSMDWKQQSYKALL